MTRQYRIEPEEERVREVANVALRLVSDGDRAYLQAKDSTGEWWYICGLDEDGELFLCASVPGDVPLAIESGRIKVRDK